jgi:glycosyltransferase involved in cell wall biosynthesis
MPSRLSAFIPAYNCEAQIRRVIRRLDGDLLDHFRSVIVIDNCSEDGTCTVAAEEIRSAASDKFQLWRNARNYGLGGTFKTALKIARTEGCDWFVLLHGDDQADPEDIRILLDVVRDDPAVNAVLGARFLPGSVRSDYSWARTWGNFALNALYSAVTRYPVSDIGSGLNLYKVDSLVQIGAMNCPDHIAYDTQILLGLMGLPGGVRFAAIHWSEEDQRSNAKNFRVAWDAVKTLMRWKLRMKTERGTPSESLISSRVL